jgi:hypothetical protein
MAVQLSRRQIRLWADQLLKHERRRQTDRRSVYAGSRLKLIDVPGRSRLTSQPSSRNGENPPCGMIGGTMETAASFEVRNAPSSYPTAEWRREAGHVALVFAEGRRAAASVCVSRNLASVQRAGEQRRAEC